MPLNGYISYSHADHAQVDGLLRYLRPLERRYGFAFWVNRDISDARQWNMEIRQAISSSDIFLILLSPDYLASDYIHDVELPAIRSRVAETIGLVLPVLLRPCLWEPQFGDFQVLPFARRGVRPISAWRPQSDGVHCASEQIFLAVSDHFRVPPPRFFQKGERPGADAPAPLEEVGPAPRFEIDQIDIKDFKGIDHLRIDFAPQSNLGGRWTCIAGVNGAGKTSVLQAIALSLLGKTQIPELGGARLKRMRRRTESGENDATLNAKVTSNQNRGDFELVLAENGIDLLKSMKVFRSPTKVPPAKARKLTEDFADGTIFDRVLFASYGANRSLTDSQETRYSGLSDAVRQQMTLFDPLTQIANIDALLNIGPKARPALDLLSRLLNAVFADVLPAKIAFDPGAGLEFWQNGVRLEAIDLPDGFRSTVAWLADLCMIWHRVHPRLHHEPSDMGGIVLVDEIDLHLHASLQRTLVPALRQALPNIQFIVTSHSPMVISCFDRTELVVLDASQQGGIRHLDRQLFGLSMDEIYMYLMGTPPESQVLSDMRDRDDPMLPELLYQSAETNEVEAQEELRVRQEWLETIRANTRTG
ncbi:MAG: TIR domain-containing protein [Acetobacteraceae bacterium]|nr:TIR domain-containing protein [Acetobacteraceae bacterium]